MFELAYHVVRWYVMLNKHVETELDAFQLLSLLKVSITYLLFCITLINYLSRKTFIILFSTYLCSNSNPDAMFSLKSLMAHCFYEIINLVPVGNLCIFGI